MTWILKVEGIHPTRGIERDGLGVSEFSARFRYGTMMANSNDTAA
jgi:hypothetical protein